MKRILLAAAILLNAVELQAQNVGINTVTPQASLDVRGNQRVGGTNSFIQYDSLGGRISWSNSSLYVPVAQYLMKHSASSEGLYYENSTLQYRNETGFTVFSTNWSTGAFAAGYFTNASGFSSTALGFNTQSTSNESLATGLYSVASAPVSTAMGLSTTAKALAGTSMGIYNDNTDNPDPNIELPSDRIFQLGNGKVDGSLKQNVITVLRNGNTGFGTLTPTEKLDVAGNINLTGQLKFNNSPGSAGQALVSNGPSSSPSWQNASKYIVAENLVSSVISTGVFQSMPGVDGQNFTITSPSIVKITIAAQATVDAGETIPQEPRFFFRIMQGASIVRTGSEGYSYLKPQPAIYVSNTMTVTQYYTGLANGTYSIDCRILNQSSGGTCYISRAQVIIEILPQ
jgi:hypothetical protein